jgi:hypothetical protein
MSCKYVGHGSENYDMQRRDILEEERCINET